MQKPRAYIVCVNTLRQRDYESLSEYTSLPPIYVTEGLVRFNGLLRYHLAEMLADFTKDDYLVLTGSLLVCAQAVAILLDTFEHNVIKVLVYNQWSNTYAVDLIDGYLPGFDEPRPLYDQQLEQKEAA